MYGVFFFVFLEAKVLESTGTFFVHVRALKQRENTEEVCTFTGAPKLFPSAYKSRNSGEFWIK